MKLKRIWHPYWLWEEVPAGMWAAPKNKDEQLRSAIAFTGDHALYGSYMRRVVLEWHYSCENALTDYHLSRKAWLGHAACALGIGVPESIVRQAWGLLTHEQQLLANKEAERAIQAWELAHFQNQRLRGNVGEPMLPGWDT